MVRISHPSQVDVRIPHDKESAVLARLAREDLRNLELELVIGDATIKMNGGHGERLTIKSML